MAKKWYVVHTYSGFENKVKKSLEERIRKVEAATKKSPELPPDIAALYDHPATPFVASFVGENNGFEGGVAAVDGAEQSTRDRGVGVGVAARVGHGRAR